MKYLAFLSTSIKCTKFYRHRVGYSQCFLVVATTRGNNLLLPVVNLKNKKLLILYWIEAE